MFKILMMILTCLDKMNLKNKLNKKRKQPKTSVQIKQTIKDTTL